MPAAIKTLLALVLCFAVLCTGCVAPASYAPAGAGSRACAPVSAGASAGDVCASDAGGHQHVGHRGERVAAYALVGLLVVAVITIDLLILAATHDRPFPCCRAVVHYCL